MRLCIVIVNHRTPGLVLDVLDSLEGQVEAGLDEIVVVDNASADGSAERLERAIAARGMSRYCRVLRAEQDGGLAAGSNIGIRAADANFYLLLNSDTIVRKGAIAALLAHMQAHPGVGLCGPRLQAPDGTARVSCFRDHTPLSELLAAADTGALAGVLADFELALPLADEPSEAAWISFACVMIRREVIEKVGLLDEGYRLGFEDSDYCRAARAAGFRVQCFPGACVTQRSSSELRSGHAERQRPPRSLYASRTRYFRKGYGNLGLVAANALWYVGRGLSLGRELLGRKVPHTRERAWLDNWTEAWKPEV